MDKQQFDELIKAIANSSSKDWFDYLTGATSLIISVFALLIGIRINKKLSLRTQYLEKQLDTVYKLVDSLYEQKLVISCREEGEFGGTFNDYRLFDLITTGDENSHLNKALKIQTHLTITWEAYHQMEFIKFSANPYLPKSIQLVLDEFRNDGRNSNNNMTYIEDKENEKKKL